MKIAYLTNGVTLKTPRQCQMKRGLIKHLHNNVRVYYRKTPSYFYDLKRYYATLYSKYYYEGREE